YSALIHQSSMHLAHPSFITSLITLFFFLLFFNDTAPTEIYTLSLPRRSSDLGKDHPPPIRFRNLLILTLCLPGIQSGRLSAGSEDRKSTRLNSSHVKISYAVFCLKKKKKKKS